jgi:biotin-(acetyl-CoA carboxylase) ligase
VFRSGKETASGMVVGVDDNARLLVRKGDGSLLVLGTGEISIRLAHGPVNQYHLQEGAKHA